MEGNEASTKMTCQDRMIQLVWISRQRILCGELNSQRRRTWLIEEKVCWEGGYRSVRVTLTIESMKMVIDGQALKREKYGIEKLRVLVGIMLKW